MINKLITTLATSIAFSASASLIDFQFNDPNGTEFNAVDNSGTLLPDDSWNFRLPASGGGFHTVQNGGITLVNPTNTTRKFEFHSDVISNGVLSLQVRLSDWDVDDAASQDNQWAFKISDADGGDITIKIGLNSALDRMRVTSTGPAGTGAAGKNLDMVGTNLLFAIVADLDNGTYDSYYELNGGAAVPILTGGTHLLSEVDELIVSTSNPWDVGGGSDSFTIDSITLDAIPEPSAFALVLVGAAALAARRQRR